MGTNMSVNIPHFKSYLAILKCYLTALGGCLLMTRSAEWWRNGGFEFDWARVWIARLTDWTVTHF